MQTIIYHEAKPGIPCPDGIMAAAVAHAYYKSQSIATRFIGATYRKNYPSLPDFPTYGDITIVDFAFPLSWLEHWQSIRRSVLVIEHHADKFKEKPYFLENFSNAVLDDKECGATLTFKHFFPDRQMPEILKEVKRRDIGIDGYYRGEIPESEAINLGLGYYRKQLVQELGLTESIKVLSELIDSDRDAINSFKEMGGPEIEKRDRLIALRLPLAEMRELDDMKCVFYDFTDDPAIGKHYSMLGSRLCLAYPEAKFCWMVDGENNHLRAVSDEINCSKIAKRQNPNGGGHPGAAGWQS